MGVLTPFFNLFKPVKTDPAAIEKIDENMDIIDTEMHRPPLTVNNVQPDPETRDIDLQVVPLADNLTSDEAQINTGTYIIRTSGGEASISNGDAWLTEIRGNMEKTGAVDESIDASVTVGADHLTIEVDRDTFVSYVTQSGTVVLNYTNAWSANPALYGITVTGAPVDGDQITVVYVKENRGTFIVASPNSFVSTGWNLYNHAAGYARVVNYSETYGFMIAGAYTAIAFAETLTGERETIEPVGGFFTLPEDATSGYLFVTGGNATTTEIWMTWSNWTEVPNGGVFEPYSQTSIDLSEVMVLFPYGLMKVANVYDEINLNTLRAYSRIEKLEYTQQNLDNVIASGVPYETDQGYIYAVKELPDSYTISIDGGYTASDHGTEMFVGTNVPLTATSLYGEDLKGKLRTDVVTISQQDLSTQQQAQVRMNIGAVGYSELNQKLTLWTTGVDAQSTKNISLDSNGRYLMVFDAPATTSKCLAIVAVNSSGAVSVAKIGEASNILFDTGTSRKLKVTNNTTQNVGIFVLMLQ